MADYQKVFEHAPDAYLILSPDEAFTIVGANDAFLRLTMTQREEIIRRPLFEIFPQNPADVEGESMRVLSDSLNTAIKTRERQAIALHRYDIRRPTAAASNFERRAWSVSSIPILSNHGTVEYIMQRVEDITALVEAEERQQNIHRVNQSLTDRAEEAKREVLSRTDELVRTQEVLATKEQKLHETEVRLEAAGDVGEVATWIWEPQKDHVFPDANLSRWYQIPPEIAHGASFDAYLRAVHPDDIAGVKEARDRSLADGSHFEVEYRIRGESVPWRWVAVRARIERDAANRPTRLIGVVIDITELRQASEALAEVQERLQLAAEAADIGVFSWSMPPGDIVSNAKCKEHFWQPPEAGITPELLYSFLHRADRERTRKAVEHSIAEHQPFDLEFRTVSLDGKIRWVRGKGAAYYDSAGHATRFDGITIDNTTLKQIEADLRGSEARYRLLIESLHDYAIFMQDDDGNVTSWNVGAERLLGYSEEEIIGRSARIFFTSEDQARGEDLKEIRTAKETGRANDDRWHVRKDGSRLFVTGMMVARYDDHGRRIGLAKIMRDITDRQIAAAERDRLLESERAARAEAERTSRLKDDFLATLSHELRTPLNAILGWTQVLKEGFLDAEELSQGLEVIDRNTRLQAELIEDLLDMSRIVSGKVRLEINKVDFAALVQSAVDSVQTGAKDKAIRLEFSQNAESVEMMGDRHRLQQVVLNLLSNAIKFTPKNGAVAVALNSTPSELNLSVRDTGVGIPREFLPHVFERFRQADASTTRQYGGLGLGLSIVKQLVELHGGKVKADSRGEGHGATFTVSLPLQSLARRGAEVIPAADQPAPATYRNQVDLRGIKVLVVDDEPDSAGLVKRILEGCHAEVRAAGSMEEALQIFPSFRPHILLSDIGMPRHDGYELIRRVRELPGGENIPAAALTALARSADVDRALQAGFQTHVAKPVQPAELVAITANLAGLTSR